MYDGHLTLHILGGSPGLEKALHGAAAPERLYCAWARFDSPAEEGWAACDVLVVDLPDGLALDAVFVVMLQKLPASLINAGFATLAAPPLYFALSPALDRMGISAKLK